MKLYTIKEVMEIFRVSRQTVHRWSNNGILKPVKVIKGVRFKEKDIKKMLDEK